MPIGNNISSNKSGDGATSLNLSSNTLQGTSTYNQNTQTFTAFWEVKAGLNANLIANGSVSNTVFQYLSGASSNIQDQINAINNNLITFEAVTMAGANVNINNPGTFEFGGFPVTEGEVVFLNPVASGGYQTNAAEGGLWVFNGVSVPMTRFSNMSTWNQIVGSRVYVLSGDFYGQTWNNSNQPGGTIDVTAVSFYEAQSTYIVGTVNSQTPSANGLVISGNAIYGQYASATVPGFMSTLTQTIAGNKTFTGIITNTVTNTGLIANFVSTAPNSTSARGIAVTGDSGSIMQVNNHIGSYNFRGGVGGGLDYLCGQISNIAATNWSGTDRSVRMLFRLVASGTITLATALTLNPDLSATFAGSVSATDYTGISGDTLVTSPVGGGANATALNTALSQIYSDIGDSDNLILNTNIADISDMAQIPNGLTITLVPAPSPFSATLPYLVLTQKTDNTFAVQQGIRSGATSGFISRRTYTGGAWGSVTDGYQFTQAEQTKLSGIATNATKNYKYPSYTTNASLQSYVVGDLIAGDGTNGDAGVTYKCNTATSGTFTLSDWTIVPSIVDSNAPANQFANGVSNGNISYEQPTYADLGGTVPTWNQDTTGNAATVTLSSYAGEAGTFSLLMTPNSAGNKSPKLYSSITIVPSTGAMSFNNNVTFQNTISGSISGNAATATVAARSTNVATTTGTNPNQDFFLTYVPLNITGNSQALSINGNIKWNPFTQTFTAANINGISGATLVTDPSIGGGDVTALNTALLNIYNASGGTGTVTNFSFTNGNSFFGNVSNASTTPDLTLHTTGLAVYDATMTYNIGNIIRGDGTNGTNGVIYKCVTNSTTGAFNIANWERNTIGTLGSGTSSANGASLSTDGFTLFMQLADAFYPGIVGTGTQSFVGEKTFEDIMAVQSTATEAILSVRHLGTQTTSEWGLSLEQGGGSAVSSGYDIGSILWRANDGVDVVTGAKIVVNTEGGWTGSSHGCDMEFYVTNSSESTPTLAMSIDRNKDFRLYGANAYQTHSVAGTATKSWVQNLDNTNGASNAILELQTGGATGTSSSGDPFLLFSVLTAQTFAMGIDNSSVGKLFKISANATLGTNDVFTLNQGGDGVFAGSLTATSFLGNSTTATTATNVATTATSTNASFPLPFVPLSTTSDQALGVDADLSYNPSTNQLTIPTINLTGGQIVFPATANPSSNANTLDDYEEGTWTPTDNSGAGLTFTNNASTYVKIGKLVLAKLKITYPATASGSSASITGLPFTVENVSGTVAGSSFLSSSGGIGVQPNSISPITNSVTAFFYKYASPNNTQANMANSDLNNASLVATIVYISNS